MGYLREEKFVIVFLCLCMAATIPAIRKKELEKAAELAVERAAERAAERAVEKALEAGNTTSTVITVKESYSYAKKTAEEQAAPGSESTRYSKGSKSHFVTGNIDDSSDEPSSKYVDNDSTESSDQEDSIGYPVDDDSKSDIDQNFEGLGHVDHSEVSKDSKNSEQASIDSENCYDNFKSSKEFISKHPNNNQGYGTYRNTDKWNDSRMNGNIRIIGYDGLNSRGRSIQVGSSSGSRKFKWLSGDSGFHLGYGRKPTDDKKTIVSHKRKELSPKSELSHQFRESSVPKRNRQSWKPSIYQDDNRTNMTIIKWTGVPEITLTSSHLRKDKQMNYRGFPKQLEDVETPVPQDIRMTTMTLPIPVPLVHTFQSNTPYQFEKPQFIKIHQIPMNIQVEGTITDPIHIPLSILPAIPGDHQGNNQGTVEGTYVSKNSQNFPKTVNFLGKYPPVFQTGLTVPRIHIENNGQYFQQRLEPLERGESLRKVRNQQSNHDNAYPSWSRSDTHPKKFRSENRTQRQYLRMDDPHSRTHLFPFVGNISEENPKPSTRNINKFQLGESIPIRIRDLIPVMNQLPSKSSSKYISVQ